MKELYQQFITLYENYRGTGKLFVLFLTAVLVIYLTGRRDQNGRRTINPAVFLLSIWTGIAYAASIVAGHLFSDGRKKGRRLSLAGVFALLLCVYALSLSGSRVFAGTYFEKSENTMHIRKEYVAVMDAILDDCTDPKVIAPPGFAPYLKMYSSHFETLYDYPKNGDISRLSNDARQVYEQLSGSIPDTKLIADIAKENDCRYVIMDSTKYYPEFPITAFGFELENTVGDWKIYKIEEGNGL